MLRAFPLWDNATHYWTYNKKWLKGFLEAKLITNLEYFEGLKLLKEVQREDKGS